MLSTKQLKIVNNPPKPSNMPLQSPAKDYFANLWSLIDNKFAILEEHIESVENEITEQ